ncbi:MAG: hypothetical protein ACM3PY_19695, partial [Omnitrophica WOR_2 bacterium]
MNSNLVFLIVAAHILGSLFWIGAVFMQTTKRDQTPTPKKAGRHLGFPPRSSRFAMYISIASWVVMFSGIVLSWQFYRGIAQDGGIPKSSYGLVMGVLAGLAAIILLLKVNSPAVKRLALVAGQTRQIGSPSTSQQYNEIKTLEERISY